jgi:hypothetical protein
MIDRVFDRVSSASSGGSQASQQQLLNAAKTLAQVRRHRSSAK